MNKLLSILIIFTFFFVSSCSSNGSDDLIDDPNDDDFVTDTLECCSYFPSDDWEKISDAQLKAEGWNSAKLDMAKTFAGDLNMAAVMLIYKGRRLLEWGDPNKNIDMHSVRKSFMSALYGSAVEEGLIDLSATIADLDIDDIDPLSDEEKEATVKMLLQARSGIYHPAAYETSGMAADRPERHSYAPGTHWYYNNWDFNVAGEIYRQQTGKDIFEAFNQEIGKPIGMKDFDPEKDGRYYYEENKSKYPAYPFKMTARDNARFGLLMARKGKWKDKQIISKDWIAESTESYSKANNDRGYGYMWWIYLGERYEFHARGASGHQIIIWPEEDIVFVYRNNDASGKTTHGNIRTLYDMIISARE